MPEKEKSVDQNTENAGAQPVVEKDVTDLLLENDAELQKVRVEKENYRKGMLKAKGKMSEEDMQAEEERVRAIARDEYLKSREGQLVKEKDDLLKKVIAENKELRQANRSKAGVTPQAAGGGSSQEITPPQNSPLSADLVSKLKNERGWTDEMIKDLEDKQRARAGK